MPEPHDGYHIWTCKIGGPDAPRMNGADYPMRVAVENAYLDVIGRVDTFNFSGWGGALTESELAVVENRMPDRELQIEETQRRLEMLMGPSKVTIDYDEAVLLVAKVLAKERGEELQTRHINEARTEAWGTLSDRQRTRKILR